MKNLTACLTAILFLFISCKKNTIAPEQPSSVDVYVAGAGINGAATFAMYWKNGNPVTLPGDLDGDNATGIAVSGNDIYVVGSDGYSGVFANSYVRYWKNGVGVNLSSLSFSSTATAIAISGNDIYVTGSESLVGKYWKNGIPNTLTLSDTLGFARATAVVVSNGDVYVAGDKLIGNYYVIEYWKNNIPVIVSDLSRNSSATAIAVSGNDIYIAGGGTSADGSHQFAMYWKNGNPVYLGDTTQEGVASSIAVSGNDVYVAGMNIRAGFTRPRIGKTEIRCVWEIMAMHPVSLFQAMISMFPEAPI